MIEPKMLPGGKVQSYGFEGNVLGKVELKITHKTPGSYRINAAVYIRNGSTHKLYKNFNGGSKTKVFHRNNGEAKKITVDRPGPSRKAGALYMTLHRGNGTVRKRQSFLRYNQDLIQSGPRLDYNKDGQLAHKVFFELGMPRFVVMVDEGTHTRGPRDNLKHVRIPSEQNFSLDNVPFRDLATLKELVHNSADIEAFEKSLEDNGLMAYKKVSKRLDQLIRKEMYNA